MLKQRCHCTGQTSDGSNYGPDDDCPECHGSGWATYPDDF